MKKGKSAAPAKFNYNSGKSNKDVKNTLMKTGIDAGVSLLAGGALGAIAGRNSLFLGVVVNAVGNYFDNRFVTMLGTGILCSPSYRDKKEEQDQTPETTVNGISAKTELPKIQKRLKHFVIDLSEKVYLPQKKEEQEIQGLDFDLSNAWDELDYIEFNNHSIADEYSSQVGFEED